MRLKNVKGANEIIVKGTYYVDAPTNYKGKWKELGIAKIVYKIN